MPRLFTYTIPVDDGAAPNPFFGMCSLAICKPRIRRVAGVGDWVAGLGSRNAPSGDLSGHLVYAMRVDEVLPMADYDEQAKNRWPHRIPKPQSRAMEERLGDCIYDFSHGMPRQRPGVHGPGNLEADLGGENVLISRHFYYFGRNAVKLPDGLNEICHQTQGHRSNANIPYYSIFEKWIRESDWERGQVYGWPDCVVKWSAGEGCKGGCETRTADSGHACFVDS